MSDDFWLGLSVIPILAFVATLLWLAGRALVRWLDRGGRFIPPPKGTGRWQVWRTHAMGGEARMMGRYRTRINAAIVAKAQTRMNPGWAFTARRADKKVSA
jgi:hypothetical protein